MSEALRLTAPQRVLLIFLALLITCGIGIKANLPAKPTVKLSPFVYVDIDHQGHGSATSLGNGFFLTAGHVTKGAKELTIRAHEGYSFSAEILWQNNEYDVAILYVKDHGKFGSAPLSCADNYVGQSITITGNPLGTLFARSWGRVGGLSETGMEDRYDGMWKSLITLDITAAPGVSGAGIINDAGQVVGILVAGAVSDRGNFNYSYGVSGKTICHLLARS